MKENSIEEDIARIAKLITTKFNNDYSIDNKDKEAIEHILSDYKRVLKENEELKNKVMEKELEIIGKEEYIKASMKEIIAQYYTANEDCIPKQKIKAKIDELKDDLKYIACGNNNCNKCFSEYRGSNFVYCYAYHQIKVLNELLESEE